VRLVDSANYKVLLSSENYFTKWNAIRAARKLGVDVRIREKE
jgi:hypothetical protein